MSLYLFMQTDCTTKTRIVDIVLVILIIIINIDHQVFNQGTES